MDTKILLAFSFPLLLAGPAQAASLQVTPVTLDIPEPGQSATLHLQNLGDRPLAAQLRVFRWSSRVGPTGSNPQPKSR
jgi:fimbrial chaperone protein